MSNKRDKSNQHNILIAHRYFWPENLSLYAAMLKDIVEWHVAQGHVVTMLSSRLADPSEQQKRNEWAYRNSVRLVEFSAGKDRGSSSLGRLVNMAIYAIALFRAALSGKYKTILIASYPPIVPAMICRWTKSFRRFEYVYYVQDIYPEMIETEGNGFLKRTLISLLKRIDKNNIDKARCVLTLSEAMKQTIAKRGCDQQKIVVIPNYAIDQPIASTCINTEKKQPTLIFAGGVGKVQNLGGFLKAAQIASKSISFKIIVIGLGSELENLKRWVAEENITNIEFRNWCDRQEAQEVISQADIGIVSARSGLFDVAYPSKSTSYLSAGLPVLVSAEHDSEVDRWLKNNRFGHIVSPTDIRQASEAIVQLVKEVQAGHYNKNDLSERSAELLSLKNYLDSYRAAYSDNTMVKEPIAMNYANDRLTFDLNKHCFSELVLKAINHHLVDHGLQAIPELSRIHEIKGIEENVEKYRQILFTLFRTDDFQAAYKSFGKDLIDRHFTPKALIQKTPTVRIHLPGGKSVSFHSDAWYGHGQRVCSFWLPLTPVAGSNSLQMATSIKKSREFLKKIESDQYDLDQINELAEKLCDPVEAKPGDLIAFNGDMVHGTVDNRTNRSRVSFDFRIAESVDEIGTKPASNFYSRKELDFEDQKAEVNTVSKDRHALMYSGICRQISAKSQLIFLNEYAKLNNIKIIGSESEIVTFNYGPVLGKYAKKPMRDMDSILLFSVELLPTDNAVRNKIYRNALSNEIELIFGAEGITLSTEQDIDLIEQVLRKSQSFSQQRAQLAA